VVGSLGAHVAVVLGLRAVEPPAPPQLAPTQVHVVFTEPPPPAPSVEVAPPRPAPRPATRRPKPATPVPEPSEAPPVAPQPGSAAQAGPTAVAGGEGPSVPPGVGAPGVGGVRDPAQVDLTLHAAPPGPALAPAAPAAPGGRRLNLRPDGRGGYVVRESQFQAFIGPDGSIAFQDKTALQKWHGVSYEVDLTEVVMRIAGDDPYRYDKLQVLKETQGLRAELYKAACESRLRTSLEQLQGRLTALWGDGSLSAARRRALVFQMWDDCAEEGSPEVLRHAEQARATIEAFVQRHLPEGSPQAFSEAELLALNERRVSRVRFEPYRRGAR
jgi:hypothetical protein